MRFNSDLNDRAPETPPKLDPPAYRLRRGRRNALGDPILQNRSERSPVGPGYEVEEEEEGEVIEVANPLFGLSEGEVRHKLLSDEYKEYVKHQVTDKENRRRSLSQKKKEEQERARAENFESFAQIVYKQKNFYAPNL